MDASQLGQQPRWAATRWLLRTGADVPPPVRASLMDSLYGTVPIYLGAVFNTIAVATVLAIRIPTPVFILWAAFEIVLAAVRLVVLLACRSARRKERAAPTDLYVFLSLLWAAGIGFGAAAGILSGDWIAALIAACSSAAMLGGIGFRYFAAPRLVCAMLIASGVPGGVACMLSGETILLLGGVQIPIYIFAMTSAAWWMNRMMVTALCAEAENAHHARHDSLTGLLNRTGLIDAVSAAPGDVRLGCLFLDLDGFKRVNDTMGHSAGDRLLALVAERLREAMMPGDIIARIGGDEFLLVAPMTSSCHARVRGEAMIAAVAGLPYVIGTQGVLIGASVGAALQKQPGGGLDDLINAADEALYRAKSGDRCQCVVADEESGERETTPLIPALLEESPFARVVARR